VLGAAVHARGAVVVVIFFLFVAGARDVIRIEMIRARIVFVELVEVAFVLVQIVSRFFRALERRRRGGLSLVSGLGSGLPFGGRVFAPSLGFRRARLAVGVADSGDRAQHSLGPFRRIALALLLFPDFRVNEDVVDVEERGLLEADIDECGLHAGKNPGHAAFVNVSYDSFS
jgi:hypothetical protein